MKLYGATEQRIPLNVFLRYLFLFALGLNFLNKFYYIFILSFLVFTNLRVSIQKHVILRFVVLIAFSLSYWMTLISYTSTDIGEMIAVFSCPIAFLMGASCVCKNNQWIKYIFAIVLGLGCHGLLNYIINVASVTDLQRATIDFWLQSEWVITGQISLFILLSGLSYYIFFVMKIREKPIIKASLIVLWVIGIQYNVLLATRTIVYSVAVNVLFSIFLSVFLLKKQIRKNIIIIVSLSLFIVLVSFFNFLNIRSFIESTALFKRISFINHIKQTNDIYTRQGQISEAFKQLLVYPFGGHRMRFSAEIKFIHNAYLNIAYGEGLIPAILFFTFSILCLKSAVDYIRQNKTSQYTFVVGGLYLATFIYLMIEPVFEANTSFITLLCFIEGVICNQVTEKKRVKTTETLNGSIVE